MAVPKRTKTKGLLLQTHVIEHPYIFISVIWQPTFYLFVRMLYYNELLIQPVLVPVRFGNVPSTCTKLLFLTLVCTLFLRLSGSNLACSSCVDTMSFDGDCSILLFYTLEVHIHKYIMGKHTSAVER